MTRQRLLVRITPVPDALPHGQYICTRCGIQAATNKSRTHSGICPDCKLALNPSRQIVAFGMLSDGYTVSEVSEALDIEERRVRTIRKRATQ